ncbi:MAG: SDR family NAD(P)-dependent oxidoreductase [Candidatus Binatia bacterium]
MGVLDGKIALVTGASRGIGEAIAIRFGAEGATVICTARSLDPGTDHLPGSLRETVQRIEALGGKGVPLQCNVAKPEAREALVKEVLERFGRVDILVNNAADATYGLLYDKVSARRYQGLFELNLRGPFELIQRFAPGMRERGHGWILNISSKTAEMPAGPPFDRFARGSGVTLYGASKAALNRLTVGLAAEFDGTGVAVNALAPFSVVWTPGADLVGTAQYRNMPGWKEEPAEAMAEAALALCTGDPTTANGLVVYSTEYLEKLGRKVHTLDGRSELANWVPSVA